MKEDLDRLYENIRSLVDGEPFYSRLVERFEKSIYKAFRDKEYSNVDSEVPGDIKVEKRLKDHLNDVSEEITKMMKELELEVTRCTRCPLYKGRTKAVPGDGNYNAKLMIIGEAPGYEEDIQGKPFVGRAGQLLTKLLEEIGIKRSNVYITNVVKCRPPNNRIPAQDEVLACRGYLRRQFEIIKPKVVLILGSTSLKAVLGEEKITKVRGEIFDIDGIIFLPTFHPAAVLRDEMNKLPLIREDFQKLKSIISKIS
ncbi:MAG: uracil-DNA glycosylase [Brevinematales bacterium]|nr:uracil-DNA glycosylase [Brevinematales bacterium]